MSFVVDAIPSPDPQQYVLSGCTNPQVGPFAVGNNLYFGFVDLFDHHAYMAKSTDGGSTWAIVGGVGPLCANKNSFFGSNLMREVLSVQQIGAVLWVIFRSPTLSVPENLSGTLAAVAFNTAGDSWGVPVGSTILSIASQWDGAAQVDAESAFDPIYTALRGAEIVILHMGASLNVFPGPGSLYYLSVFDTTTTAFTATVQAPDNYYALGLVAGAGGRVHAFLLHPTVAIRQASFESNNSLGATSLVATLVGTFKGMSPVHYDGTNLLLCYTEQPVPGQPDRVISAAAAAIAVPVWTSQLCTSTVPLSGETNPLLCRSVVNTGPSRFALFTSPHGSEFYRIDSACRSSLGVWSARAAMFATFPQFVYPGQSSLRKFGSQLRGAINNNPLPFSAVKGIKYFDVDMSACGGNPPVASCNNPPNGTVGTPYTHTFTASDGTPPYTFAITAGALPTGLTLDPNTGIVSGTPTVAGTFAFDVQVTDSLDETDTVSCSITINPVPVAITCDSPPGGTVGVLYTHTFPASGGTPPYTFVIIAGALPTGLTLNANTGVVSGTPTVAGTFNFDIQVTDSLAATATVSCSITISAAPPTTLNSGGIPEAIMGCLPRNEWDWCAFREALLYYGIKFPPLCSIPKEYRTWLPWDEDFGANAVPPGAVPLHRVAGIVTPAPAAGDQTILEYRMPLGYDGLLAGIFHFYSGAGFTEGSGDILWRLRVNLRYIDDLGNLLYTLGSPQSPMPLTEGQILLSGQTLRYIVNVPNLSGMIQVGQSQISAGLIGFLWPR